MVSATPVFAAAGGDAFDFSTSGSLCAPGVFFAVADTLFGFGTTVTAGVVSCCSCSNASIAATPAFGLSLGTLLGGASSVLSVLLGGSASVFGVVGGRAVATGVTPVFGVAGGRAAGGGAGGRRCATVLPNCPLTYAENSACARIAATLFDPWIWVVAVPAKKNKNDVTHKSFLCHQISIDRFPTLVAFLCRREEKGV